ncbi:hypothetical protein M378DRAFT_74985, partial [Amanita muscaria Koide BX008]
KKDWKLLSLDEKKTGMLFCYSLGPLRCVWPRAPVSKPGDSLKHFRVYYCLDGRCWDLSIAIGVCPPKTMSTKWQEQGNERVRQMNVNPITGTCSIVFM